MAQQQQTHWKIVCLETTWCPIPDFNLPEGHTCEFRKYELTSADTVAERIRDADIVIMTIAPMTVATLSVENAPRLKMIAITASGTDTVDLATCRKRGIVVANSPHCNETSVVEHALGMYFATRRYIIPMNSHARAGDWVTKISLLRSMQGPDGKPPRLCSEEVVGIIGYGAIGKLVQSKFGALGMKIIVASRKGGEVPEGRVSFETALRESSVLILCLPRSPDTMNLISDAEFNIMRSCALVINVSRGGIVDERALISALKEGKIAGAATDVYPKEPAGPSNSVLLSPEMADLNLVTTPHVAWYAEDTHDNYYQATTGNVIDFVAQGTSRHQVC
ncbi:glycerate dehydrogenase [Xylariaceae sp. FL0255]|nr:glycerate dehydrogenase [Xylariaceae sp. FL0255]